jgi:hypothetical protein
MNKVYEDEELLIDILEELGSDFVIITPDYHEYHIALGLFDVLGRL